MPPTSTLVQLVVASCLLGAAAVSAAESSLPLRIGADQQGGNAFEGDIAGVRFHRRSLAAAELATLAAQQPGTPPSIPPTWEWRQAPEFDSRMTRAGKVESAVAAGVSCVRFRGGFLQAVTPPPALDGDFTIDCWIRPAREGTTARLVDRITPGGTDGFLLDFLGGRLRFILLNQTVTQDWEAGTGVWAHVAAVGQGGQVTLHVNGRLAGDQVQFSGESTPPEDAMTLWWRRPWKSWTEAMVLGNGRLGAMVSGGVQTERLWLNEDTLWSGEPFVPNNPEAIKALPEVRRLLIERQEKQAHDLFNQKMLGPWNECYLPLGNLQLRFPIAGEVQNYRRALDLRTGVATVQFRHSGVTHTRELFSSFPDQAIVLRITADQPGQVSFSAVVSSPIRSRVEIEGRVLRLTGRCPTHADPHYLGNRIVYDESENPKGMTFAAELRAIPEGGTITVAEGRLSVTNCNAVTVILVAATSFNGFDKSPSREGKDPVAICRKQGAAADTPYATLRQRHAADFSSLMDRVALDLGTTAAARRPTDERLRAGLKAEDIPALAGLYTSLGGICWSVPRGLARNRPTSRASGTVR